MAKTLEGCIGCDFGCEYHNEKEIDFTVPGELINEDSENVRILVNNKWLDKNARKVGYACLDELFFYDDKPELLTKLAELAVNENAVIRKSYF